MAYYGLLWCMAAAFPGQQNLYLKCKGLRPSSSWPHLHNKNNKTR